MLNPQLLIRFVAVAEHLSFSAAATALGIDQATLSRQIRQMEAYIGFSLFERSTRSVALTAKGRALLPVAQDLSAAYAKAGRTLAAMQLENASVLRIGTNPYVYWSPQMRTLLKEFTSKAGSAKVETVSGTSSRQLARLRAGTLDIALVTDTAVSADIEALQIMTVKPHLLLPRDHALSKRRTLTMADLAGLAVAIASPGRDKADFDRVYRPFFMAGAEPVPVSEGGAAVVYYATTDKLAMISLRSVDSAPHEGFVRRNVTDAPEVDFMLARLRKQRASNLGHRFWQIAARKMRAQN